MPKRIYAHPIARSCSTKVGSFRAASIAAVNKSPACSENQRNSHHYVLELQLDGAELDEHGYLVDIVRVETELGELRAHYADRVLNELSVEGIIDMMP